MKLGRIADDDPRVTGHRSLDLDVLEESLICDFRSISSIRLTHLHEQPATRNSPGKGEDLFDHARSPSRAALQGL